MRFKSGVSKYENIIFNYIFVSEHSVSATTQRWIREEKEKAQRSIEHRRNNDGVSNNL